MISFSNRRELKASVLAQMRQHLEEGRLEALGSEAGPQTPARAREVTAQALSRARRELQEAVAVRPAGRDSDEALARWTLLAEWVRAAKAAEQAAAAATAVGALAALLRGANGLTVMEGVGQRQDRIPARLLGLQRERGASCLGDLA